MHVDHRYGARDCTECGAQVPAGFALTLGDLVFSLCEPCLRQLGGEIQKRLKRQRTQQQRQLA